MKFRLVYYGPLRPNKRGMDIKEHKHRIRRVFHRQLKELWHRSPVLTRYESTPFSFAHIEKPGSNVQPVQSNGPDEKMPFIDLVQHVYSSKHQNENGYVWVPLLLKSYDVLCELDILLLFAGSSPRPLEFGDLDNRVKTLIDSLRQPDPQNIVGAPTESEMPFCVLLQDDDLVTKLQVETDSLFRPPMKSDGDRLVHVTITVTLKPFSVNMFNLKFA